MYNLQCHRLLMTNRPFKPPAIPLSIPSPSLPPTEPTRLSRIISARKTGNASSSLKPGISMLICTQDPCPPVAAEDPSVPSRPSPLGPRSFCSDSDRASRVSAVRVVFSTSAFTPTMACVPSAKPMRALPFVPGRISHSAVRGRNCVGERPSGRMGFWGSEREV